MPDAHPLTPNALIAGCNQKTSRDPILNATEGRSAGGRRSPSLTLSLAANRIQRRPGDALRAQRGKVLAFTVAVGGAARRLAHAARAADHRRAADQLRAAAPFFRPFRKAVEGFLHELVPADAGALVDRAGAGKPGYANALGASGSGPVASIRSSAAAPRLTGDVVTVTVAGCTAPTSRTSRAKSKRSSRVSRSCARSWAQPARLALRRIRIFTSRVRCSMQFSTEFSATGMGRCQGASKSAQDNNSPLIQMALQILQQMVD